MPDGRAALAVHGADLIRRRDVVAVAVAHKLVGGLDTGSECVTVFVRHKLDAADLTRSELVPPTLQLPAGGEVPTDVVATAPVTGPPPLTIPAPTAGPLPGLSVADLRSYVRPVTGGLSGANWRFGVGTITTTGTDSHYRGVTFALSCNHVLAGLNRYPLGDPLLQPAPVDGGRWPAAVAGQLARFVPIRFDGGPNLVDAAAAYVPGGSASHVHWLGPVTAVRAAAGLQLGQLVRKVGRTSGLTSARLIGLDAMVWVDYSATGLGGQALLTHQVVTTPCAGYGDSGSLLVDDDLAGIGLLCAGSTDLTIFNSLELVQQELDVVIASRRE